MNLKKNSRLKKKSKEESLSNLLKINGIGWKTIKDLKRIYLNRDELIEALKNDKVPLRDDIVVKLKKHFGIK